MALDDGQVIIPGTGHVYFAPVGTPKPSNPSAPATPWAEVGHTSVGDGITITRDGGDSNILGSWQNKALRDRRDPVSFSVVMFLLQLSNETLALYFGGGDASISGAFGVSSTPSPQNRGLYVRIQDGNYEADLYVPKVSVAADDDVQADVENFLAFPVRATCLGITGSNLMEWYAPGLGGRTNEVQSIAITGAPTGGTYTLTYSGQTTAAIAWNATATVVQTALRALTNIGSAGVTCTGGPHPGSAITATFGGDLAGVDVAQMTATASLTGGTAPAIAVTTVTPGG